MSSFTRTLTFALVVGLLVSTAGAVAAADNPPAPAADELSQDAAHVEAASDTDPAACTATIPEELILPDPNPQLCPDDQCVIGGGCSSVCPRGGECVQFHSCPSPVCVCF